MSGSSRRPELLGRKRRPRRQGGDAAGVRGDATLEHALYWKQIYSDILAMQERVLERIRTVVEGETVEIQREVALTNVPVVVDQVERFRQRLGYWEARIADIDGQDSPNCPRP